jgi:hypothetical protein
MLPAPPLPEENLLELEVWGIVLPKSDAGPRAEVGEVVVGVKKVLPAPPRPEWMYFPAEGWGSVIW